MILFQSSRPRVAPQHGALTEFGCHSLGQLDYWTHEPAWENNYLNISLNSIEDIDI